MACWWIEISKNDEEWVELILQMLYLIPTRLYILLKATNRLKLPDALIVSTAMWIGLPFVTADKDFKNIPSLNLILL